MGFTIDAAGPDSAVEVELVGVDAKGNELGVIASKVTFTEIDESLITFTEGASDGRYIATAVGPAKSTVVAIAKADDPSVVGLVDVTIQPGPVAGIDFRRVVPATP